MTCGRRLLCGSLMILVIAPAAVARSDTSQATVPPVAVQIVPTSSRERTGQWIELANGGHFHVVVANLSSSPIRLWEEWCSWGYFNLSFEARESTGSSFVISKKNRGWDKNFPCPVVVDAGHSWVIDVNLEPSIWENSPLASDTGKATLRLRAIFEIREGEQSKTEKVWTGKVSSPEAPYTVTWAGAAAKATLRRLQNVRP